MTDLNRPSVIEQASEIIAQGKNVSKAALSDSSETYIEYRPNAGVEKWFKQRFSAFSEVKAWFAMTLAVLFFYFGGPGFIIKELVNVFVGSAAVAGGAALAASQMVLYVLYSVFGGLALTIGTAYSAQPTHLVLGRQGMRLHWKRWWGQASGGWIEWKDVTNINLLRPSGKTTVQQYRLTFNRSAGKTFTLKMGAITTTEGRETLLAAIDHWAPAVPRDPEIMELLSPPHDYSYTELWLQALTAPPKRERLTPLSAGTELQDGRYVVREQLGVGGQGTAYLASLIDPVTRKPLDVVLKESILPVYVEASVRRQALESFQREAAMLRTLSHPQIVKLIDFFIEDHRSYMVLEHINGLSLRRLVETGGRMQQAKVLMLAMQMCRMLEYLHGLSPPVVHRDFTPDNLILDSDTTLKLIDFTVAQQTESTATGTVVGKHAYLPPEQFRGKPTPQSDIYAMGATLFYLLTAKDPEPITASHPLLDDAEIDGALDELVARATSLDLSTRYPNIISLRADLENLIKRLSLPENRTQPRI
jgi:tRNA A-37 threonylcarbamoyl transferase component Bud32